MIKNELKVCLVNLVDLDPPRNGGLSRVAHIVSDLMAQLAEQGDMKVFFAVGWSFSGEFRNWLGRSGGEVIPVLPEAGPTPLFQTLKPDLVISPLFGMKPCADWDAYREIPHIVSMPDALVLDKPELFNDAELKRRREVYDQLRSATVVVTLSENARRSLMRHLDLREDQILAIPLAGDLPEQDLHRDSENIQNLDQLNITSPYILYPARNWPHKRHDLLLSVMREISLARDDLQLVLTGWHDEGAINDLARKWEIPREKIIDLNYVSDAQMIFLYRNAEALMFVSEYEGFGMPILEAMQNGCPVICAPVTSIPEVAGDAALYVDSEHPQDWAKAFLEDLPLQRENLIQKGFQQAQKFTWEKTQGHWRDLIGGYLKNIQPRKPLSLPYLQELKIWADYYAVDQAELVKKEKMIHTLHERWLNTERRERDLQEENRNLQEEFRSLQEEFRSLKVELSNKENIIRSFQISISYWLRNGPFHRLFAFPLLSSLAVRVRDFRRIFLPKVGVLEQHPPLPLLVPGHYTKLPLLDPAKTPRISIVTPSYHQAAFIERTAKSVLDQGYPNLEYVVQDGGSTDGTLEVMRPYLDRLKHFESRPDRGQAHAINLGMMHTSGEIMAYLNSDDILLPGSLNYVADYFLKHPDVDVIYSHRLVINEEDEEIGRWILPRHDHNIILWADFIPQETLFWRRSLWKNAGNQMDESYQFALDWDMLIRFRAAGAKFVRVPRFLAAFRVQSAQKTSMHMNSTGLAEMDRLRKQIHSRNVEWYEIMKNIKPYLNRSVIYHKLHWLGVLRY